MMTAEEPRARAASLAKLFEKRLKVRGSGLEAKLNRAGRKLPAKVRRDAELLVAAERAAGHPRLMRQLDPAALEAAHADCARWLRSVDLRSRRRDRALNLLAANVFNLMIVAGAFTGYLAWSGHL